MDKEEKFNTSLDVLKEKDVQIEKLKQELEIVKKQANQTHQEYMKLTDQHVALEEKLNGRAGSKKDN